MRCFEQPEQKKNSISFSGSFGPKLKIINLTAGYQRQNHFSVAVCVLFGVQILNHVILVYLSGPLQVAKVDIRDKEDRLGLQVSHGFEESCVGLLRETYHTHTSIFPLTPVN